MFDGEQYFSLKMNFQTLKRSIREFANRNEQHTILALNRVF